MASTLLTPHELVWEKIVYYASLFGGFFAPLQAQTLWSAPFLAFIFNPKNLYMLYIFTTFAWFDMAMGMGISNVYFTITGGTKLYCLEAQMLSAFYATAAAHFIFYEKQFPGWVTLLTCTIGFTAGTIVLEASSAISVLIALCVGIAFGILRILFFVELIGILTISSSSSP